MACAPPKDTFFTALRGRKIEPGSAADYYQQLQTQLTTQNKAHAPLIHALLWAACLADKPPRTVAPQVVESTSITALNLCYDRNFYFQLFITSQLPQPIKHAFFAACAEKLDSTTPNRYSLHALISVLAFLTEEPANVAHRYCWVMTLQRRPCTL